ncbi:MAG: T9SS type A sorting domain-containing protein [Daejeonella sp.]
MRKILLISKDKNNKVTLEIANIPNGNYFLHITEGKKTIKKQIIIQH